MREQFLGSHFMKKSIALSLLTLAGWVAVSLAGPPLATGDLPTATAGILEIYEGRQYQENADGSQERATSTEFAYGINDRLEANFELPYLSEETTQGWGDTTIGSKYMFVTETSTRPGFAGSAKWVAPTGNATRGLGRGISAWAGRLRSQKTWAELTGMANLGYTTFSEPMNAPKKARENPWFASVAVEYRLLRRTALLAEIYWQTREKPGAPNRLGYSLGFKQKITGSLRVHGAIGGSLRNGDAGGPQLRVFLGLKYEVAVRPKAVR